MKLEIMAIITALGVIWAKGKAILGWIGQKWTQIAPIAIPLIIEAEKLAADGKIDRADRKQIVMDGLKLAQDKGMFKLNYIESLLLPFVVDQIAQALPDIKVSQNAQMIVATIVGKINEQKQSSTQP